MKHNRPLVLGKIQLIQLYGPKSDQLKAENILASSPNRSENAQSKNIWKEDGEHIRLA